MATPGVTPTTTRKEKIKRTRPVDHTPPDKTNKKSKDEFCSICNKNIPETAEDDEEPQQAVFCEGECSTWIHRQCAGLSLTMFTKLGESDEPYMCLYCILKAQNHEIQKLKTTVKSLTDELATLKNNRSACPDHEVHLPSISESSNNNSSMSNRSAPILNQSKTSHVSSNHAPKPP